MNEYQKKRFVTRTRFHVSDSIGKRIAILGYAFKDTNDTWEFGYCNLQTLARGKSKLAIYDPKVKEQFLRRLFSRRRTSSIEFSQPATDACKNLIVSQFYRMG